MACQCDELQRLTKRTTEVCGVVSGRHVYELFIQTSPVSQVAPGQHVSPLVPQLRTQFPFEQLYPLSQTRPQPPQF